MATHELGGKDAKKHPVIKMELPKDGSGYAILVKPSGSLVQRPKVFSQPVLLKAHLPFPKTIEWDLPLLSFKFKVREWKLFIEAYKGPSWFLVSWSWANALGLGDQPSPVEIPSPRMGTGGYSPEEFFEESPLNWSLKSAQEEPPKTPSGTKLFPPRSSISVQSVGSGQVSLPTRSGGATINEKLAPFIRRIHLLENCAALPDNSLPLLFALVRGR